MGMTHNFKHRERLPFVINTPKIHEVLLGGYIQFLSVLLRGSLVISSGTANGTSLGENPGNFIQRLVLESASKGRYPDGYLRRVTPRTVLRRRIFDSGWALLDTALSGAAGTFTLNQNYRLNFAHPRIPRPVETSIKTDEYSALQLRVECGSRDTQFTGNDRTFDFSGVTLDVYDHRESMSGDMTVMVEDDLPALILAANPNFIFTDFPAGMDYMDVLVVSETTNQQLADTIVNRFGFDFGQNSNYDLYSGELRAQQEDFVGDNPVQAPQTGLYYFPLNRDGLLAGAIPIRSNKQAKAIFDVSNPGGAGNDRLLISSRRILTPGEFLPQQ